ncbi:MAG TPA: glycosyltransferase family 87 protein [Terracidiphilus sp.]|jgi:hypothetical protein|nr:glycosyltransferase family 87 protein [Terracidiphilus sp.]
MSDSIGKKIAAISIVLAGFCFVGAVYWVSVPAKTVGQGGDYIGYWAAGQQLAHRQNPYDVQAVMALERTEGFDHNQPSITPSPPAAWLLLLPLGWMGAKTGVVLWGMFSLASAALSLRLLWELQGKPRTLLYLFGFVFAPVIVCLVGGQLGIFFLLAVTLFFYLLDSHPFLAGAALLPCALKPHLFFALFVVLLLWAVHRQKFQPVLGFFAALAASAAITLAFDPQIWPQYLDMWRNGSVRERVTPTLSVAFRFLIDANAHWLEFVPALAATVWAVWYFWTRRDRWHWLDQGLVVLLASVMCAPYAWFTDESVLLAALMAAALRALNSRRALLVLALPAAAALIEVARAVDIKDHGYIWTTPAWLLAYIVSTRISGAAQTTTSNAPSTPAHTH